MFTLLRKMRERGRIEIVEVAKEEMRKRRALEKRLMELEKMYDEVVNLRRSDERFQIFEYEPMLNDLDLLVRGY